TGFTNAERLQAAAKEHEKYRLAKERALLESTERIFVSDFDPVKGQVRGQWQSRINYWKFPGLLKDYTADVNMALVQEFETVQFLVTKKRVLSYVDFLYFSSVTGATVGYGDITPNQWYTRLLVT